VVPRTFADVFESRSEPPVPPIPADLGTEWTPSAEDERWWESQLELMDPFTRFEAEFGAPAVPERAELVGTTTEDAAVFAQDLAVRLDRMRTIAEAHRISALLTAYEASMEDLAVRFGPGFGRRDGLGAQAFFRSMGLQIRTHPNRLSHEVDTATTLRDRLPLTWDAFQRADATWTGAQTAVREAEGLDAEHWPAYDAQAATLVASSHRLKDDLRKTRERLQDDTAAKRARTTHERRRTSLEPGHDGGAAFVAEGLATDWIPVNDALHRAAVAAHGADGETRGIAQLRHDIALDLLREGLRRGAVEGEDLRVPQRKPVEVTLVLTVPALAWLGRTTEQARLGGYGPIDLDTAKDLAASAKSFVRVLTDPFTGARLAMDQRVYAPPADLARWVRIRDGRSRFPGSDRPAHLSDIDHAREWQHGGPTDAANLVTLDRSSHNLKSAGLFEEELLDTGVVGWHDAWGHRFEDPPDDPLDPAPPELLPAAVPLDAAPPGDACPF
jgi:hypothetical protein